ncbi:MAG: nucleotidyl transferase AbiEii/AbiGii toxin family protein [Pseudomonas sp.]
MGEDLEFTGGADFDRTDLAQLKPILTARLETKYGLNVTVSEPQKESGNVDTWKLKVQIRPEARHLPAQRINIDVCAIPSYMSQPKVLLNPYGVDMGTQGLILNAEALEEVYADKMVAFALRRGRIKNRDLWDLLWLKQQGVEPALELIPAKLKDHQVTVQIFLDSAQARAESLVRDEQTKKDFRKEMQRFLPAQLVAGTVNDDRFWAYLTSEIPLLIKQVKHSLNGGSVAPRFLM